MIEQGVLVLLGKIKRQFDSGVMNKEAVQNMDETHSVVNMENGKILGLVGNYELK